MGTGWGLGTAASRSRHTQPCLSSNIQSSQLFLLSSVSPRQTTAQLEKSSTRHSRPFGPARWAGYKAGILGEAFIRIKGNRKTLKKLNSSTDISSQHIEISLNFLAEGQMCMEGRESQCSLLPRLWAWLWMLVWSPPRPGPASLASAPPPPSLLSHTHQHCRAGRSAR